MPTVTEPARGRRLLTAMVRRARIAPLLVPAGAAFAGPHDTTLVSRAAGPAGASANAGTIAPPAVSADGRFVTFWSNATNLSPDDSDALYDLYRRDVASDATVLVSRASGKFGPKAAGAFYFGGPSISGDGRLVAFMADAANLSPDDKDALGDIYVRDLDSNETILVSRASRADGVKANGSSFPPDISADGRFVAFGSEATNLTADQPTVAQVYVRDLATSTTTLVSRETGAAGAPADRGGSLPAISGDGRFVAFTTGSGLDPADRNGRSDVYVRDRRTETTTLVSRATGKLGAVARPDSRVTAISADGRAITFFTRAQLSPDDSGSNFDVYVRNLATSTTTLVSRATGAAGARGDADSRLSAISGDGRLVAFSSPATNLSAADIDPELDVFVRDTVANTTTLVSRASGAGGAAGDASSFGAAISDDGRVVAFGSRATNLSAADSLGDADTYVRELRGQFPPPLGGARRGGRRGQARAVGVDTAAGYSLRRPRGSPRAGQPCA